MLLVSSVHLTLIQIDNIAMFVRYCIVVSLKIELDFYHICTGSLGTETNFCALSIKTCTVISQPN